MVDDQVLQPAQVGQQLYIQPWNSYKGINENAISRQNRPRSLRKYKGKDDSAIGKKQDNKLPQLNVFDLISRCSIHMTVALRLRRGTTG